jgi:hypothetical protein
MPSPAVSAQTSNMSGNSWSRTCTMRRGVVDASVAWTYTNWLNLAFLIPEILFVWRFPKTGDAATLRMMSRPAAMGALPIEPSKSDSIKINLIGITRPIHICTHLVATIRYIRQQWHAKRSNPGQASGRFPNEIEMGKLPCGRMRSG